MALRIDEYSVAADAWASAAVKNVTASSETAETQDRKGDSYIPSGVDSSAAIPNDQYNDILKVMSQVQTGSSEDNAGGAASGGGEGSSGSEEETTTKTVTINGVTYLETTTTKDGTTTVTKSVINEG